MRLLYQGRFKAIPVEEDDHLLSVLRYVERNPLTASLCEKAEDWKFGSLWRSVNGDDQARKLLSPWPIDRPRTWKAIVNRPQSDSELNAIRHCTKKGCPYGNDRFVTQAYVRLKLKHILRSGNRFW